MRDGGRTGTHRTLHPWRSHRAGWEGARVARFSRPHWKDSRKVLRVLCLCVYPQRWRFPKEARKVRTRQGGLVSSDFTGRASRMWWFAPWCRQRRKGRLGTRMPRYLVPPTQVLAGENRQHRRCHLLWVTVPRVEKHLWQTKSSVFKFNFGVEFVACDITS